MVIGVSATGSSNAMPAATAGLVGMRAKVGVGPPFESKGYSRGSPPFTVGPAGRPVPIDGLLLLIRSYWAVKLGAVPPLVELATKSLEVALVWPRISSTNVPSNVPPPWTPGSVESVRT